MICIEHLRDTFGQWFSTLDEKQCFHWYGLRLRNITIEKSPRWWKFAARFKSQWFVPDFYISTESPPSIPWPRVKLLSSPYFLAHLPFLSVLQNGLVERVLEFGRLTIDLSDDSGPLWSSIPGGGHIVRSKLDSSKRNTFAMRCQTASLLPVSSFRCSLISPYPCPCLFLHPNLTPVLTLFIYPCLSPDLCSQAI